jgi:hypothetical protein
MRIAIREAGCLLVAAITATAAIAQTRPDFSGVWKPVQAAAPPRRMADLPPDAAPLPKMPPPVRMQSITIVQSASELKVEQRWEQGDREDGQTFVYKLDGTESVNKVRRLVYRTTAMWKGDALVLTSEVPMEGQPDWRITDVYRIENGGLVIQNTTVNSRGTFSGKRAYTR